MVSVRESRVIGTMSSHPSVIGNTGAPEINWTTSGKDKASEQKIRDTAAEIDRIKRDTWLCRTPTNNILVGEGITLADVHRWLKEATKQ